jgi:Tfp pilus assembly protein PilF
MRAVVIAFGFSVAFVTLAWSGDLEEGKRLFNNRKWKEAAERFALEARKGERSAEANLLWGLTLVKQHDFDRAETVLKEATRLDPKSEEAHTLLGWLYLEGLQDPRRAIPEFLAAVQAFPNSPEAHNNLGTAFDRVGDFDRALESYGRAITLRRDYIEALSNRGWSSLHRKDPISAKRDFLSALSIRPNDPGALSGLAQISKEKGELSASAAAYRKLISASPNFIYVMELLELYTRQYFLVGAFVLMMASVGLSLQKRRKFRKKREQQSPMA